MGTQQAVDAEGAAGPAGADGTAALLPDREEVLVVKDADDFFGLRLVDGQARVLLLDHGAEDVVQGGLAGNTYDVVAGHHYLAHANGFQIEDAVDHVLGGFRKVADVAAGGDDHLQLFGGVDVGVSAFL